MKKKNLYLLVTKIPEWLIINLNYNDKSWTNLLEISQT